LPPWLATFADLMSLLMCFFVLLLSFSEIDAIRFKKMAESMRDAFGVQREKPVIEIVKGVSVIKQEWSPTVKEQAVISEMRQETSDFEREHLEMGEGPEMDEQQVKEAAEELQEQELKEQMTELQESLEDEIKQGVVAVERDSSRIIVRIREKGSFPSGSARLDPQFQEVMDRISRVLVGKPGQVVVAGHTDNIPIRSGRFRSNWELSAARAVNVLHALLKNPDIEPSRVLVEGHADTRPVAPNDTAENRSLNRRVELVLVRGSDRIEAEALQLAPHPEGQE
jgi:chemotaxis protein MotB